MSFLDGHQRVGLADGEGRRPRAYVLALPLTGGFASGSSDASFMDRIIRHVLQGIVRDQENSGAILCASVLAKLPKAENHCGYHLILKKTLDQQPGL